MKEVNKGVLRDIKAGDKVRRILGGEPMVLRVTEVDQKFIYCGPKGGGWKFDRKTGIEVDELLEWGPSLGISGSYLEAEPKRRLESSPFGVI